MTDICKNCHWKKGKKCTQPDSDDKLSTTGSCVYVIDKDDPRKEGFIKAQSE